ncbi:MAG TPA: 2-amino-4-hydroxy-6-hydroxymethyldihydropteridine diphosphokinase [Thermoanaerobaculia bacterium]|nr:2-amino-4-hydroxy-6-hydroxymethyldihydropteridine diphosphokinase [Thermoanaerobaculia bacterium]
MVGSSGREKAVSVVVSLGSNVGDRRLALRRGVRALSGIIDLVRISSVYETNPLEAPRGSLSFLNLVVAGSTRLPVDELMERLLEIERRLGRRRGVRNAPRSIDLDIILYGAFLLARRELTVPHPRYRQREFVLAPLREMELPWSDPATGQRLRSLPPGAGEVRLRGRLW